MNAAQRFEIQQLVDDARNAQDFGFLVEAAQAYLATEHKKYFDNTTVAFALAKLLNRPMGREARRANPYGPWYGFGTEESFAHNSGAGATFTCNFGDSASMESGAADLMKAYREMLEKMMGFGPKGRPIS
jgi:hypothetical protein